MSGIVVLLIAVSTCIFADSGVTTVSKVEIRNYLGVWNELYRIPNGFQDNSSKSRSICFNTTAEYTLDGEKIAVKNTCQREDGGKWVFDSAEAVGSIVDRTTNAKLSVNFTGIALLRWLGIGDGDYWILGLGPVNEAMKYAWALVGNPTRKYGWILARDVRLPELELEKIFEIAEKNGYVRSQFIPVQRRPERTGATENPSPLSTAG